jgi:hypothetical protein
MKTFRWLVPVLLAAFAVAALAQNNTWYVSLTGLDTNPGTLAAPFATFAHALAAMKGCDTLVIANGHYYQELSPQAVNSGNISGTGCYTTIEAATTWGVTIDDSTALATSYNGAINNQANYIQFIGIIAAGNPSNTVGQSAWSINGTNHVKLQMTAGYNAPCIQNTNVYGVGPAASYVLVEDSHAWGCGRYKFEAYQSSYVIFRRDVARHDYHDATGWVSANPWGSITGWGRQVADFTTYDSQNVILQNVIAIDSGLTNAESGKVWGGLWSEHNDPAIDNPIEMEGSIILNVQGIASIQDQKQSGVHTFINNAAWGNMGGLGIGYLTGTGITPPTTTVNHMTIGSLSGTAQDTSRMWGVGVQGNSALTTYTSQIVENSIFASALSCGAADWVNSNYNFYYLDTANFCATYYEGISPVAGANDVLNTNPQIQYITREEPGTPVYGAASDGGNVGATIVYEIGATGTLWGDPGYDTITTNPLWPFPNEAQIKTDMASFSMVNPVTGNTISGARGFAALGNGLYGGPLTLTSYIWEYLGYPCPVCSSAPPPPPPPPAPVLTAIAITPSTAAVAPGASQQFSATCTWTIGPATVCTNLVAWSTGQSAGITINSAGLTTAAASTATITASLSGITATATLTTASAPPPPVENAQYIANSYAETTIGSVAPPWTLSFTCTGGEFVAITLDNQAAGYSGFAFTATNGNVVTTDYFTYAPELIALAHISSCVAGQVTVTVNVTGSGGTGRLQASRFTGLISGSLDSLGTLSVSSGTNPSCGVIASGPGELLIVNGYGSNSNTGFIGSGSGYVLLHQVNNGYWATGYNLSGVTGPNVFSETIGSSAWHCILAAYK